MKPNQKTTAVLYFWFELPYDCDHKGGHHELTCQPHLSFFRFPGGALTGGLLGAVLGSVLGPLGTALGAAVGGFTGAAAGEQIGETLDHRQDLVHLAETFSEQDYYVMEMEWEDYEPAYRYGFDTHATHSHLSLHQAKHALSKNWCHYSQHSHLTWTQAWDAILHAWALSEKRHLATH